MAEGVWNYKSEEITPIWADDAEVQEREDAGSISGDSDDGPATHLDRIRDPNKDDKEEFEMRRFVNKFNPQEFFCDRCGSVFDLSKIKHGKFTCACGRTKPVSEEEPLQSTVCLWERKEAPWWQLSWDEVQRKEGLGGARDDVTEHPEIDQDCPKCGNTRLQFWTRQLRSADEGMSVFFLCKKCGWRTVEK
mmetsp:Transcript_105434/g.297930  ORF Transcript_105434/g.297930 Transcript_105434/m.297930 type:complete len:191 (-) Transcript_105434:121-693(-)